MAEKADTHSTSSLDAEAGRAHGQPKPEATKEHIEYYAQNTTGYSRNLRAVQEAQGFKPTDGRLVVDPAEARVEYGDEIASKLKTNHDGTKILWPQRASRQSCAAGPFPRSGADRASSPRSLRRPE